MSNEYPPAISVEAQILAAAARVEKRSGRSYAWMIQAQMDLDLCEQTIRRYMVRLAEQGKLVRLGERRGYRLPSAPNSLPLAMIDRGHGTRVLH